ncbi:MAG TPA: hypothetical protein VGF17_05785, partial [Phytomonospora sp.]
MREVTPMRTRRPYDPEERDPGLAAFRRTAIRLHPRPGDPGSADSSVGGPLLWPAGETWPVCEGAAHDDKPFATVAVARRERRLVAARNQAKARGEDPAPVEESLAELRAARRERSGQAPSPQPLIGVAQLYARDAPGLPYPDGTDLLQILWCPYSHPDGDDLPLVRVVWRASGAVGRALADPSPGTMTGDPAYVPQTCTVSPEVLAEYPPTHTAGVPLPPELRDYDDSWSLADGWKAGGWGNY